ncbi:MAG: hypothetical protein ACRC6V_02095 [Bacteroidales bacterium]
MLNLAERYWNWKANKFRFGLVTNKGFKVKRFGADLFAVKAGFGEGFVCVEGTSTWFSSECVVKYCARSREKIERKFGKILGLEDEEGTEITTK